MGGAPGTRTATMAAAALVLVFGVLFRNTLNGLGGTSFTVAVLVVPAVFTVIALLARTSAARTILVCGAAVLLILFGAAIMWDAGREREHPVWLFAIVVAPFFAAGMIPVVAAAWLAELLHSRRRP